MAKNFMKKMDETDVQPDGAMPASMDARAKTRLDIDTTVTDGDLSIMDLMDIDVPTVMAKYSNRASGQIALANKGIKSELELDALRRRLVHEGGDEQAFEDAANMLMGRPTRDGLDKGLNELKDAVSLSKMGGLGMAQLSEAGTILSRTVMQLMDDPKVFKKVWSMAGESTDNVALMRETQALAGISNEVHLLTRQANRLDVNDMKEIERVKNTAHWIAGKASFGKYKAPASYILGQVSGFNMIRRFQRRLTNASFMIDTAKAFKDGTGTMSEARMRDIGLDPQDADLKRIFRDVVTYDEHGIVNKLNLDQWDKKTREKYHLAMYRDDAQMVQQTIAGEMPQWINKPAMTLVAQFKQAAIQANKKQLTRQMQFADKEAALGAVLNAAMAGLTRTAKFATLGGAAYAVTGDERDLEFVKDPLSNDNLNIQNYVSTFGFFPDMTNLAMDSYKAYDEDSMSVAGTAEAVAGEIPLLGWMKDYADIGMADSTQEKMDAAKGVAILGNMQFADIIYKGLEAQLED